MEAQAGLHLSPGLANTTVTNKADLGEHFQHSWDNLLTAGGQDKFKAYFPRVQTECGGSSAMNGSEKWRGMRRSFEFFTEKPEATSPIATGSKKGILV